MNALIEEIEKAEQGAAMLRTDLLAAYRRACRDAPVAALVLGELVLPVTLARQRLSELLSAMKPD